MRFQLGPYHCLADGSRRHAPIWTRVAGASRRRGAVQVEHELRAEARLLRGQRSVLLPRWHARVVAMQTMRSAASTRSRCATSGRNLLMVSPCCALLAPAAPGRAGHPSGTQARRRLGVHSVAEKRAVQEGVLRGARAVNRPSSVGWCVQQPNTKRGPVHGQILATLRALRPVQLRLIGPHRPARLLPSPAATGEHRSLLPRCLRRRVRLAERGAAAPRHRGAVRYPHAGAHRDALSLTRRGRQV